VVHASVPIPKFAHPCGTLSDANFGINSSAALELKFLNERAGVMIRNFRSTAPGAAFDPNIGMPLWLGKGAGRIAAA
jgi:hypothetical protein